VIRHVVALQLASKDPVARREHSMRIKSDLEGLADAVQGILAIDVHLDLGVVATHWPIVLIADYDSTDSLDSYQDHPRHKNIVDWMNSGIVSDRAIVDFELT